MIISSLPENIDARLARNRINMNLPPDAGRPDDIVIEDSLKFLEVYEKLDKSQRNDEYWLMGVMEMRLAIAMIYEYKGQRQEAKGYYQLIDKKYLNEHVLNYYNDLNKKLGS
jgi:hypothetical protein